MKFFKIFIFLVNIALIFNCAPVKDVKNFKDPKDDFYLSNIGESYLDIKESSVKLTENGIFEATISLYGNIPFKINEKNIFIEWDIMIDYDKNKDTNPCGGNESLGNNIGVDYLVRLCQTENYRWAEVYNCGNKIRNFINYQIKTNRIILNFSFSDIGNSTDFNYITLVRKYSNKNDPNSLAYFDKAPNKGYISFRSPVNTAVLKTKSRLHKTSVRELGNYSYNFDREIISRIKKIPDFLLDYWKNIDRRNDYVPYIPIKKEIKLIQTCLNNLPDLNRRILEEKLIGIYFIKNFLTSGLTHWVLDKKNNIYIVLIFDSAVLKNNISKWLTIKENTCFIKNNPDITVKINCGTKYSAFLYILLHETAHAVDYINRITPYVENDLNLLLKEDIKMTDFTKNFWLDYSTPELLYNYTYRKYITFYKMNGGPKINITDCIKVYKQLSKTPFISLYGSLNWAEDFAELLSFYHLTQKLHQPYIIQIYNKHKLIFSFSPVNSIKVKKRFYLLRRFY